MPTNHPQVNDFFCHIQTPALADRPFFSLCVYLSRAFRRCLFEYMYNSPRTILDMRLYWIARSDNIVPHQSSGKSFDLRVECVWRVNPGALSATISSTAITAALLLWAVSLCFAALFGSSTSLGPATRLGLATLLRLVTLLWFAPALLSAAFLQQLLLYSLGWIRYLQYFSLSHFYLASCTLLLAPYSHHFFFLASTDRWSSLVLRQAWDMLLVLLVCLSLSHRV